MSFLTHMVLVCVIVASSVIYYRGRQIAFSELSVMTHCGALGMFSQLIVCTGAVESWHEVIFTFK